MADLSSLFGQQRGSRTSFLGDPQRRSMMKLNIISNEALQQGLTLESGDRFDRFVQRRLLEMGELPLAMMVKQARQSAEAGAAEAEQQAFENQRALVKEALEERKFQFSKTKEPNLELKKIVDPTTGKNVFVPEAQAVGMEPAKTDPLVVMSESAKLREKAATQQDIARGQALPLVETYLDTLNELNAAIRSGDFQNAFRIANKASAQEAIAGRAVARLQEEGKLTDEDVQLALRSMPSVVSIRNALSGGAAFEDQESAFRQILQMPQRVGSKAPQDMTVEEIEAELKALRGGSK